MAGIQNKKPIYPISDRLRSYLVHHLRETNVAITYQDLFRFNSSIALFDRNGKDTLWETLIYDPYDRDFIFENLIKVYAELKVAGDISFIEHLYIDRVDLCLYGNTKPIRVRVVNKLNDLFDYFYIKTADASRVYGMELEHLLSPNKINFLTKENTIIEEHIPGIPGDDFIKKFIPRDDYNPLRVAKEFVKFNERCLVQLLGDMRNDNFVVEVIPDFDETYFRLRAIDFDQQSYEGNYLLYLPQFFKENNPIISLGFKTMSPKLELQYQKEERTRILVRYNSVEEQIEELLSAMASDYISPVENINQLKKDLSILYSDSSFVSCTSMGELLMKSLEMLRKYPIRPRQKARFREVEYK